jgi:hypothetical protein
MRLGQPGLAAAPLTGELANSASRVRGCSEWHHAPLPRPGADGPTHPGWRHLAFKVDDIDKMQNLHDTVAIYSKDAAKTLAVAQDAEFLYEAAINATNAKCAKLGAC